MLDVNPNAFRTPLRIASALVVAVALTACAGLDHTPPPLRKSMRRAWAPTQ